MAKTPRSGETVAESPVESAAADAAAEQPAAAAVVVDGSAAAALSSTSLDTALSQESSDAAIVRRMVKVAPVHGSPMVHPFTGIRIPAEGAEVPADSGWVQDQINAGKLRRVTE